MKVKVLRVMGQVAATPHVRRHALIASDYAITLINVMYPKNLEEVRKERNLHIDFLRSVY
ncbi:putative immunity protein [Paenibacillus algorifonticola]|uniref:putative immunity protein n=1 Tax=Paenibacillus algorifonticola TaxID=684063 RepID=UPI003CC810CD